MNKTDEWSIKSINLPKVLFTELKEISHRAHPLDFDGIISDMLEEYTSERLKGFKRRNTYPSKKRNIIKISERTHQRLKELAISEDIPIYELIRQLMFIYRKVWKEREREFAEKEIKEYLRKNGEC